MTSFSRVTPDIVIALGVRHMLLNRSGTQYHLDAMDVQLVSRHRL